MDRLRKRTVFSESGLDVTVTESLELRIDKADRGSFLTGRLKPVAIVITDADGSTTYDIEDPPAG